MFDYVIVGTGLTGATIARVLADRGKRVVCVERRNCVGGNVADKCIGGTWVHTYGPHFFRTQSTRVWDFVNRFTTFRDYRHSVVSYVGESYQPWPPVWGEPKLLRTFPPRNFEEACIQCMSEQVYNDYVRGYTEKQWGCAAQLLPVSLSRRFTWHKGGSQLHPKHRYQGIPTAGYSNMVSAMLQGIPCIFGVNYDERNTEVTAPVTVYTGSLDVYFRNLYGPLKYRCQYRVTSDGNYPYPQINYPSTDDRRIRTIAWDKIQGEGTKPLATHEFPVDADNPDEYEYPSWDRGKYEEYKKLLRPTIIPCGRLGNYRYLDMDQAIAAALHLAEKL